MFTEDDAFTVPFFAYSNPVPSPLLPYSSEETNVKLSRPLSSTTYIVWGVTL
jgi:hypothetical protein